MADIFKVLSILLSYPTEDIQASAAALGEALDADALLSASDRKMVAALIDDIATRDIYDLQERYILLFDRSRSLSLHLFEHVHGESRDRGQAMVDLIEVYERHGLSIEARELPDYLPMFLEFLSTLPVDEARELLGQPIEILTALRERLRKRKSRYAAVFYALEALAKGKPNPKEVETLLAEPEEDPNDLEALDRIWEEEAVTFGPDFDNPGACPKADDLLQRIRAESTPVRATTSPRQAAS
jgi:nitrate reductase delta subunit